MFGQRDNSKDNNDTQASGPSEVTPTTGFGSSKVDDAVDSMLADNGYPTSTQAAAVTSHAPGSTSSFSSSFSSDNDSPSATTSQPTSTPVVSFDTAVSSAPTTDGLASNLLTADDELLKMKQEALQQLQPLVSTLQQTPEEEFRTLMMMIQATDDKSMLKKAMQAAKNIKDDKARAQAMLDVVNEINYFTQVGSNQE